MESSGSLELLTTRDVCEELRVSRSTLNGYRRAGRFPEPLKMPPGAKRPRLRWTRSSLTEWITGGSHE